MKKRSGVSSAFLTLFRRGVKKLTQHVPCSVLVGREKAKRNPHLLYIQCSVFTLALAPRRVVPSAKFCLGRRKNIVLTFLTETLGKTPKCKKLCGQSPVGVKCTRPLVLGVIQGQHPVSCYPRVSSDLLWSSFGRQSAPPRYGLVTLLFPEENTEVSTGHSKSTGVTARSLKIRLLDHNENCRAMAK